VKLLKKYIVIKWALRILTALTIVGLIYYFLPETKLPADSKIDELIVSKSQRTMEAYSNGQLIKIYKISLGQNPFGNKEHQGDKRTPEGKYTINDKNPNSGFHKNLGVSYPNAMDKKQAEQKGLDPGGDIKIHGLRNGIGFIGKFHRLFNWTAGCMAVTDDEIDELYNAVDLGTTIVIKP
jgi:murein L,D-transpeptidase YafK